MRVGSRDFRPGWAPTLAMLAAAGILCGLGTWQVQRLRWKTALLAEWNDRIDRPPLELDAALEAATERAYRRARARGRYDVSQSILVRNLARGGQDGARLLTPLLREGGVDPPAVLVDRGWVPSAELSAFVAADRGQEPVEVQGVLFELDLAGALPGRRSERRVDWVRFDPRRHAAQLQEQLPYRIAPVLIQREDDGTGALPLGGFERPRSRVDHASYAITWYSMAAIAVGVWVGFGLQRGREAAG